MTDGIERFEALPAQTLHVPLVASYIHCLHHPSQRTRPQITRLPFGASAFHLQSVFNLTSSAFSGRRQALPPTSSPRALSHSYSGYAGSRTWERHRYRNDWWLRVVVAATATHSAVVLLVVAGNRGHQPCKGRVQLLASRIRKLNLRASYPHDDVTTDGATSQLCVDCVSPCIDAPCFRRPRSTPPSPVYARVYAREAATSTRFCAHTYSPLLALFHHDADDGAVCSFASQSGTCAHAHGLGSSAAGKPPSVTQRSTLSVPLGHERRASSFAAPRVLASLFPIMSCRSHHAFRPCLALPRILIPVNGMVPSLDTSRLPTDVRAEQNRAGCDIHRRERGAGDQHFNPLQGPGIRVPSGMDRAARCSVQELALLIALLFRIYVCPSLACPDAKYASNRPRGARVDPGSLPRATPP